MPFVVVKELIPETVRAGAIDAATLGFIVGVSTMMALDNALGQREAAGGAMRRPGGSSQMPFRAAGLFD
jgi:hypothetical protein